MPLLTIVPMKQLVLLNAATMQQQCRASLVITTAQLHPTKPELRFCISSNLTCGVLHVGDSRW